MQKGGMLRIKVDHLLQRVELTFLIQYQQYKTTHYKQ